MILNLNKNSFFIFDLDDTLFPEIEYLESAYRFIAEKLLPVTVNNIYAEMLHRYELKENVFDWIVSAYSQNPHLTISYLLQLYREHEPKIKLNKGARELLDTLKGRNIPMGLITDGRSITQRNKLKALQLGGYFEDIIISEEFGSEKPDARNYLFFHKKYPGKDFYFIGDNTSKDFVIPLKLGWVTICLKSNERNIHPQNIDDFQSSALIVSSFEELNVI